MTDNQLTGELFLLPREHNAHQEDAVSTNPDSAMIRRAASGNEEAFAELYRKFAPMVHGIALARVPRSDADDLVQEVFISVHKNLNSLRDHRAIGPWLAQIARNRAADFYRRHRTAYELDDEMAGRDRSADRAFEVMELIRALPVSYSETLTLRLVEGMTGPEIARRTGMTHDSVRVNLNRGMKMLRKALGKETEK